jgi:NADPH:quinone reductase-like Zn-dependent oxidoreductase
VKSLGADRVIDYTQTDFTEGTEKYDVIVDNVGNHPLSKLRRVMTGEGRDVIVGGPSEGKWLGPMKLVMKGRMYSKFVEQEFVFLLAEVNPPDLELLNGLMRDGKVTPVIDKTYPFSELPEAIRYLETGRARGKVVVRIE